MRRLFSKEDILTDDQLACGKMFNITNFQGNANWNHNAISPHACQSGYIKKAKNNKCWQGCGEIGTLVHCWWECKMVQLLWSLVLWFLKKLKIETSYDPAIPLTNIYSKVLKAGTQIDICTPTFTVILLKQPQSRSNPVSIKCGISTQRGLYNEEKSTSSMNGVKDASHF